MFYGKLFYQTLNLRFLPSADAVKMNPVSGESIRELVARQADCPVLADDINRRAAGKTVQRERGGCGSIAHGHGEKIQRIITGL